ncbi:shikimate kinase [Nonomuraea rosea]|uniref:shikimate kinase n=1 Tax=Nonomuraea rosea TaxID=638574 RepID=UPI0031ECCFD4
MTTKAVLIGPPGSGKTTLGRLLAERLGVEFRDTDTDVEAAAGKPVADIFVEDGEVAFRTLEHQAVRRALAEHEGILSLGGGAVLDEETQALLDGHHVVYLQVGLADAVQRVGLAAARPLLVLNPRSQLKKLMEERRPVYERLAVVTVITDKREPAELADEIVKGLPA